MTYGDIKTVKIEIEFNNGRKVFSKLDPQMMQELMAYHDISALEETFQSLLKSVKDEVR